jgi:hypothetical protein
MTDTAEKPLDEGILAEAWAKTPVEVQTVVQALAEEVSRLREVRRRSSKDSSQARVGVS